MVTATERTEFDRLVADGSAFEKIERYIEELPEAYAEERTVLWLMAWSELPFAKREEEEVISLGSQVIRVTETVALSALMVPVGALRRIRTVITWERLWELLRL